MLELNDKLAWTCLNYAANFDGFTKFTDNVERIHVAEVSCQEFIDKYEKIYKPVVIEGCQVI